MTVRPLAVVAALCLAGARPAVAQQARHTYVIVHGAWGGGWDWRAVDSMLTGRGHRVVRVTRLVPGCYVLFFQPGQPAPFQRFADRAAARGWPVYRLQSEHTAERTAREPLVDLLNRVP